jgi:hypothetical protein
VPTYESETVVQVLQPVDPSHHLDATRLSLLVPTHAVDLDHLFGGSSIRSTTRRICAPPADQEPLKSAITAQRVDRVSTIAAALRYHDRNPPTTGHPRART